MASADGRVVVARRGRGRVSNGGASAVVDWVEVQDLLLLLVVQGWRRRDRAGVRPGHDRVVDAPGGGGVHPVGGGGRRACHYHAGHPFGSGEEVPAQGLEHGFIWKLSDLQTIYGTQMSGPKIRHALFKTGNIPWTKNLKFDYFSAKWKYPISKEVAWSMTKFNVNKLNKSVHIFLALTYTFNKIIFWKICNLYGVRRKKTMMIMIIPILPAFRQ